MKQKHKQQLKKIFRQELQNNARLAPHGQYRLTVSWPIYDEKEILGATETLLKLQISQGPNVRAFEAACAKYVGTKYAVAVNSGSSANLLALATLVELGEVKRGSEVIIPAATFSTVASPIIQLGLIPVYVDVDKDSWNIDPQEIKKAISQKTRVLMPVHSLGNPADMSAIMKIAKKHKLLVLEDCCEAHGASIGSKRVGSFGHLATMSFFVAHNITTGEGGMIFTNSKKYYETLQSLREFGRLPLHLVKKYRFTYPDKVLKGYDARYIFTRIGYNVRMTDIAASLGIEQLKKLNSFNAQRVRTVKQFNKILGAYKRFFQLPEIRRGTFHSFYGYQFLIRPYLPFSRLQFVKFLEDRGIETRPYFAGCLPDQPGFRNQPKRVVGALPVSRYLRDHAVFIGCHPKVKPEHITLVKKSVAEFLRPYQQEV